MVSKLTRRGVHLAAVVLLAVASACTEAGVPGATSAPPDTTGGGLPLRFVGPGDAAIAVPVRINGGEPVNLILDTGATLTCLDEGLAQELNLPERRGAVGAAVGVGGSGPVRLHGVDSLRVGEAVAYDLMVCALDLATFRAIGGDVRGLLGLNFMRDFRVTIDFDGGVLHFTKPGA